MEERRKGLFVDSGTIADLRMPHVLALSFKQPVRIFQRRSVKEAGLHVPLRGMDVGYRSVTPDPAPIPPPFR